MCNVRTFLSYVAQTTKHARTSFFFLLIFEHFYVLLWIDTLLKQTSVNA